MLFWTCPECGRECSPALRQCPACPPPSERQPVAGATLGRSQAEGAILALAQNLETIHAVPLVAPVPEQPVQARENGHNSHGSLTATLIEETPIDAGPGRSARFWVQDPAPPAEQALLLLAEETLEIPVKQAVDSLVRPLVESVDTAETGAVEPPGIEAAVLTEAQPEEEPSAIVPSDISTAESHASSDLAAIPQEPAGTGAECETVVPEPEHVDAAPVPSSEPEPLSQAGSPYEVTAIPELYVALASWAHQIRELEQALEPEGQSPEQELPTAPSVQSLCEATAAPEVQVAADSSPRQGSEPEQASEPEVLSAIEAADPNPTASLEVQEPAFEDAAANSWAHQIRQPEQVSEPEVLSAIAAPDLTAGPEVQEPAFEASATDASPESTAVPEIDAAANRQSEQASEPEVLSAIAAPDLTASPEVQEPAFEDAAADASPESTAVPEIDAAANRQPEQASEPEVLSATAAPDLTTVPVMQEPAVENSAADSSPESTAVPEIDAAANRQPEQASEPEVLSAIAAPDLTASPEVQEPAFEDAAADASPESTAVPEIDAAANRQSEQASEPEVLSAIAAPDLTTGPAIQEPAVENSATDASPESTAVPEIDAAANSWAHQIREPEQALAPEVLSAIAAPDLTTGPAIQEPAGRIPRQMLLSSRRPFRKSMPQPIPGRIKFENPSKPWRRKFFQQSRTRSNRPLPSKLSR